MTLHRLNCLTAMKEMPDCSVDSIVTDPPYELGFMGKSWDNSGIAYSVELWSEALRILKPGGHLLTFGGSRTYHRLACAVEDAGFEIRDQIMWVYGSGFPKSLDVSKAIDKAAGAEREVVSEKISPDGIPYSSRRINPSGPAVGGNAYGDYGNGGVDITAPATPEAQQWDGWGTALKPAHEPIVVARKPLIGTVAANVLTYGTGALNIDGSRVGSEGETARDGKADQPNESGWENMRGHGVAQLNSGRWPANFIHDGSDEVVALFPDSKGGAFPAKRGQAVNTSFASGQETEGGFRAMGDSGSAARFFYCAKASKSERNAGLEGLPEREGAAKGNGLARTCATCGAGTLEGCDCPDRTFENPKRQNFHPTVKPLALMRYLVKLVTPPNGIVLDPFLGSGTTAVAAILEGFEWIGCEMTEDYWPIVEARTKWAKEQPPEIKEPTLFSESQIKKENRHGIG